MIKIAWNMTFQEAGIAGVSNAISSYTWHGEGQSQFLLQSKHSEALAPDKHEQSLRLVGAPLKGFNGVKNESYEQLDAIGEALIFLMC